MIRSLANRIFQPRYYEKLKPSCVDAGLSYEERVKMREEEIQSLQEALRILSGEDI